MVESRRYLGLELAGAKNQKTALAALEYYPKEGKVFLLDIYDRLTATGNTPVKSGASAADDALLELIEEFRPVVTKIGVNVPLELPPCMTCIRKKCPLPSKCTVPAVKWMREITKKTSRNPELNSRVREFTPYTQRPIELWIRYQTLPHLPDAFRFEIDEALGGTKAPLTARMNFLKRQLDGISLVEVWPKLSIAVLAMELGLSKQIISSYRHLETGSHARESILEAIADKCGIFIYERDVRKLAQNLTSFDAFICAYSALLSDVDQCNKAPAGYPSTAGWVQFPILEPMG